MVDAEKPQYQQINLPEELSQYEMLKTVEMSQNMTIELYDYCQKIGIPFMSTSYDLKSLNFLESNFDLPAHKLASIDVVDHRLVEGVCQTNKPSIISTAMANLNEVNEVVQIFKEYDNLHNLILLQCVFNYPCLPEDLNLNVMNTYRELFKTKVGLSDHSESIYIPSFAVAKGASVIEKHFTLNRSDPGPDHRASMEPDQMKQMVNLIRLAEKSLGDGYKKPINIEIPSRTISRKSIISGVEINKGDVITNEMLVAKRPGSGFFPTNSNLNKFIGKIAKTSIRANTIMKLEFLE